MAATVRDRLAHETTNIKVRIESLNYETTLDNGTTVTTTVDRAPQGARAYSIAFDGEANVIGETDSTLYVDYCHAEIVALGIFKLFPEIEPGLPWSVVSEIGLDCDCD